jgi:ATP-dependent DNA helicase RecQ
MNLKAGYILDCVSDWLREADSVSDVQWGEVLQGLCSFHAEGVGLSENPKTDSILKVAENLICRGYPTKASPRLEAFMSDAFDVSHQVDDGLDLALGNIRYESRGDSSAIFNYFYLALCALEPRIKPELRYLDSSSKVGQEWSELSAHHNVVPKVFGEHAFQLLEPQRSRSTLSKNSKSNRSSSFQRVDFALSLFASDQNKTRLVLEIDGSQHRNELGQQAYDELRDHDTKWPVVRLDVGSQESMVQAAFASKDVQAYNEHFATQLASQSITTPLWGSSEEMVALSLIRAPLAVARLQLVLIRLIQNGVLSLESDKWNIAVLERDVSCSRLALDDFQDLMAALLEMEGAGRKLPEIILQTKSSIDEAVLEFEPCNVLIDLSTLLRTGYTFDDVVACDAKTTVVIRNGHQDGSVQAIRTGRYVKYKGRRKSGLTYFLNLCFRKEEYREGQVEVIKRALSCKSTIALLPTGAGKSITYQLPTLLQPGIAVVVDPIKSLMSDQVDGLKSHRIDRSLFINSSLTRDQRAANERLMSEGRGQFVFISPERFLIEEFREFMRELEPTRVAYAVIDEAHCVSEWGHDFRTSYLQLGHNLRRYCKSCSAGVDTPLLGLTGTASFDVLSDVQRELNISNPDAVITPSTFQRDELNFYVEKVDCSDMDAGPDSWEMKKEVVKRKYQALIKALNYAATQLDCESFNSLLSSGDNPGCGIVFTPHKNWKFGVKDVCQTIEEGLEVPSDITGVYGGADSDKAGFSDAELLETQHGFKSNDIRLLVATKAFGMGIDKPNIRFTTHFNMPQSIESFYQEAGRAGRDREKAICMVLHSPDKIVEPEDRKKGEEISFDREMMMFFHRSSFPGQAKETAVLETVFSEAGVVGGEIYGLRNYSHLPDTILEKGIPVFFDNSYAESLALKVSQISSIKLHTGKVKDIAAFNHSWTDFTEQLGNTLRKTRKDFDDSSLTPHKQKLEPLFLGIRNDQSTLKAIYRLTIVGFVDDFTIDYVKHSINVTLSHKPEEYYLDCLQTYLSRYMSEQQALDIPAVIMAREEPTLLKKCLAYLMDFVYERIASKRLEAIVNMEDALLAGQPREGLTVEECRERFSERIYSYFESRYTPELRTHASDSKNLEVVADFVLRTNGIKNELRHLNGAARRLLESYPDHVAYRMIRSLTELLLEDESTTTEQALQDLRRAISTVMEEADTMQELMDSLSPIAHVVRQAKPDRADQINTVIYHTAHALWLSSINQSLQLNPS